MTLRFLPSALYAFLTILGTLTPQILAGQVLFSTEMRHEEVKIAFSPNGQLAVAIHFDYINSGTRGIQSGFVLHRTADWSTATTIRLDSVGINLFLTCYGFLNDSTVIMSRHPGTLLIYNFKQKKLIDSINDSFFGDALSDTTVVIRRESLSVVTFSEYNVITRQLRVLLTGASGDRLYTHSRSPYVILWSSGRKPRVCSKQTGELLYELNASKYTGSRHPFTFSTDGSSVYALAGDNHSIGTYTLEHGYQVATIPILENAGSDLTKADVYVNTDTRYVAYTIDSGRGNPRLRIVNQRGESEASIGDLFVDLAWIPGSSRYYLSGGSTVTTRDAEDPLVRTYIGVKCDRPTLHIVCDATKAILNPLSDDPLTLDIPTRQIGFLRHAPPDQGTTLRFSRLIGSDTLIDYTLPPLTFLDLCSGGIDEHPFVLNANKRYMAISEDRRTIVALSSDSKALLVNNLTTSAVDSIPLPSSIGAPRMITIANRASSAYLMCDSGTVGLNVVTKVLTTIRDLRPGSLIASIPRWMDDRAQTAIVMKDARTVVLYRNFPNDKTVIELEDQSPSNRFFSASLSKDGSFLSLAETSGSVRILDATTLSVVASTIVEGHQVPATSTYGVRISYDPDTRILESTNCVGEFVLQRWPSSSTSISAPSKDAERRSFVGVDYHDHRATVHVNSDECITSIHVFDILGASVATVVPTNCSDRQSIDLQRATNGVLLGVVITNEGPRTFTMLVY